MEAEKKENIMPNFFLVGAARSGTTSLARYLGQHPEIYLSPRKEVHYFAENYFPYSGSGDDRLNDGVIHDEQKYYQLFTRVTNEKAVGEASVFYLCLPGVAERIARVAPEAKIIIILREPVERAYSSYMLLVRDGREHLSFSQGLSLENERREKGFEPLWWYKEVSLYYKQVKRYIDVFGPERVKVLLYDDFCTNTIEVLRSVFAFLEVKEDIDIDVSVRHNIAGVPKSKRIYQLLDNFTSRPNTFIKQVKSLVPMRLRSTWGSKVLAMSLHKIPLNTLLRAELSTYFVEDIGKLEVLLHRDLSCWTDRTEYTTMTLEN